MKCVHCRGEMKPGTTPFHIDRKGCHVTLDEVPAWVREQCGESYFEEKAAASLYAARIISFRVLSLILL